jgi:hypothetical protein
MNSHLIRAALLLLAPLLSSHVLAAEKAPCWDQGFSCANLVYQGYTYPFERQDGSYLYVNQGVYPYVEVTDDPLGNSTVRLPHGQVIAAKALLATLGLGHKTSAKLSPVIGYGSNPAPAQITRKLNVKKFQGDVVVPVMKGTLKDFDVAWTPVFVSYGSMPSTLTSSPGTVVDLWVTWLDKEALQVFDGTEHDNPSGRPLYVNSTIKGADYQFEGPDPGNMQVYISCFGALTIDGKTYAVSLVPAEGRKFTPINSPEAVRAVMPTLGWKGDVLDLIYDNVVSQRNRATRSTALKPLGARPDIPGAEGLESCKASWAGAEKSY